MSVKLKISRHRKPIQLREWMNENVSETGCFFLKDEKVRGDNLDDPNNLVHTVILWFSKFKGTIPN